MPLATIQRAPPALRGFLLVLSIVLDIAGLYAFFAGLTRAWAALDGFYLHLARLAFALYPVLGGIALIFLARRLIPALQVREHGRLQATRLFARFKRPFQIAVAAVLAITVAGFAAIIAYPDGVPVGTSLVRLKVVVNRALNGIVAYVPSEWLATRLAPEEGALFRAVEQDSAAQVRAAIARGHPVNEPRYDGFAPLHAAARHSTPQVVTALLDAGADIDLRVWGRWAGGRTPLMAAAMAPGAAKIDLLLARGAHAELRDANEWTALDYAAYRQNRAGVDALCRHEANTRASCSSPR